MKLRFYGDIKGLEDGIQILGKDLKYEVSEDGIPVGVEKTEENIINIVFESGRGAIRYKDKIHFFRSIGLFIEALQEKNDFVIVEQPQFCMNGAMFDMSRNAVFKVDSIKMIIRKMGVMGLNTIMLYTEDTYEIENEHYFGYMRGRYTYEELKECDDYADVFGIEIIPCIQTLGHMEQFLKWNSAAYLRDTQNVLLADSDSTYEFIEKMITAASAPFRSKRIHIGMDEAHDLGLGAYLDRNGYVRRFDIMSRHLKRVLDIASKHGLKPMIWSDMYFRLGSKTGWYYDLEADIPQDVIENIPEGIQFVYWDYYHKEEEFYRKFIEMHRKLKSGPIFAGGIWTWLGISTNYGKTFKTTNAALEACKNQGVKEVFATIWGDNGSENNFFSALPGLQLYAEHGYSCELDIEKLKKRFKFCTGADYDDFMELKYLDEIPGTKEENFYEVNASKTLLYQDALMGLFDKNFEEIDLAQHYEYLEEKMKGCKLRCQEWGAIFDVAGKLCSVLKLKGGIGNKIKACYDAKDFIKLKEIAQSELPEIKEKVEKLRDAHRENWLDIYKPFGWEVLDIRYGGVIARLDTAIKRIWDYLEGHIQKIEELEEERLYFELSLMHVEQPEDTKLCPCNTYTRIVTAGSFG